MAGGAKRISSWPPRVAPDTIFTRGRVIMSQVNRRKFLTRAAQVGAVAAVGDFAFLKNLPPLSAQDVRTPRDMVRYGPDIEPLVRFIEDTDRAQLLERVAERIRGGTSYH